MKNLLTIYHGSTKIIERPERLSGNRNNDYGQGFYCTENYEAACEWASRDANIPGYVNEYSLDVSNLKILDLGKPQYNILNWLTILIKNRTPTAISQIGREAQEYLLLNFDIDTTAYDVVIGYRADDSYFSFARDFLNNTISLEKLKEAMKLGELGIQVFLASDKAFAQIEFINAHSVDASYHTKYLARDSKARAAYQKYKAAKSSVSETFMIDIIREEIKNGDKRLQ